MDIIFPFSESKLKPHLKMASKRIQIANSKRTAHSAHGKREVESSSLPQSYSSNIRLPNYLKMVNMKRHSYVLSILYVMVS